MTGDVFLKQRRKSIQLDYFYQRTLLRLILGFYKKATPKMIANVKILAKCKDKHGFPYPCESTLHKWFLKFELRYKRRNRKIQVNQGCDSHSNTSILEKSPRPQVIRILDFLLG